MELYSLEGARISRAAAEVSLAERSSGPPPGPNLAKTDIVASSCTTPGGSSLRARLWSIGVRGVDREIFFGPPPHAPAHLSFRCGRLPNPHCLECCGGLPFPCGVPSLPAARMQPSVAGWFDAVGQERIVDVLTSATGKAASGRRPRLGARLWSIGFTG
jgi:hypothetical protein